MRLTKATVMQSVVTIGLLALVMRYEPAKDIVLNERKFLGIF